MNALERLHLPDSFGSAVLFVGLALCLAPYLRGADFGVIKIPDLPEGVRRSLVVVGPLFLAGAVLLHVNVDSLLPRGDGEIAPPHNDPKAPPPAPSRAIFAPVGDGACYWPVTATETPSGSFAVVYPFDRSAEVQPASLRRAVPAQGDVGERVYAETPPNRGWASGTVSRREEGRVLVLLDRMSDCNAAKPNIWVTPENVVQFQGD